jgi:hypothetical protein
MNLNQLLAHDFNEAVNREYPMPDSPHTSVIMHATDNRAAMWRGIRAVLDVVRGAEPSITSFTDPSFHEPSWQHGYATGYAAGLGDGRAEFTNPAATSPTERRQGAPIQPTGVTLHGLPVVIDDTVPPGTAEFRSGRRIERVDIEVKPDQEGGAE